MGALRDLGRLLAVFALVLRMVFLTLVLRLSFVRLAFLALLGLALAGPVLLSLFRVLTALVTERRRAGFSGVVTDGAAGLDLWRPRLRPSPVDLASWDRCSE